MGNSCGKRCLEQYSFCPYPCKTCYHAYCEQCRYGYMSKEDMMLKKYSIDELRVFSEKCELARESLKNKNKQLKE